MTTILNGKIPDHVGIICTYTKKGIIMLFNRMMIPFIKMTL